MRPFIVLLAILCIASPAYARYEALPHVERQLKGPAKMPNFAQTIAAIQTATWIVEAAVEDAKGAYWRWLYGARPPPR